MEVLFEYRGSRRQLSVSDKESLTRVVSGELQRVGKARAQVFTANDNLPARGDRPEVYLLQKWSDQWDCYVDVAHHNEVSDGDKLAVIAKPKPPSRLRLLCCCASDTSHIAGKVGGSKNKVPKTEEIQSLEYRYRVETDATSDWEEDGNSDLDTPDHDDLEEGEQYIRAESGRAAWKLAESDADSRGRDSAIEMDDVERPGSPVGEAETPSIGEEQDTNLVDTGREKSVDSHKSEDGDGDGRELGREASDEEAMSQSEEGVADEEGNSDNVAQAAPTAAAEEGAVAEDGPGKEEGGDEGVDTEHDATEEGSKDDLRQEEVSKEE